MERRLSAIMAADVVGYSRLMGANEVATLTALNERRAEILEPNVAGHGGRVFKFTGDGLLAEFPSVTAAIECASGIQSAMRRRNADVPDDRQIVLRIGINLGDVIVQGDDLFGDGVNLAARIEGVAPPGGIAVSAPVREQVGTRLPVRFESLGRHQLKNIDRPIEVYRVDSLGVPPSARSVPGADSLTKPSIAVLPFDNMSADPEQGFFSDGISEDIITDLSRVSGLFVIGRHTSFAYRARSVKLDEVAAELGVRYVLEGSVRKVANRVRVTAQLIDANDGGPVWAERFDRDLDDIFAIQDEITRAIVGQLRIHLVPQERIAIEGTPTASVEAYSQYLKGRQLFHNATKSYLQIARRLFVKATDIDPAFARAYAGIVNCDCRLMGWYGEALEERDVLENAERAIALNPELAEAHAAHGDALSMFGHEEEAVAAFDEALRLDPNSFDANHLYARLCSRSGHYQRSIPLYMRALEIQPDDPQSPLLLSGMMRNVGQYADAERYAEMGVKRAELALEQHPEWSRPAHLAAATLAALGKSEEARAWMERALAIDPDDPSVLYNVACTFTQLGETDRALDTLEKWWPIAGRERKRWLVHDTDFNPLRGQPRFEALLKDAASW